MDRHEHKRQMKRYQRRLSKKWRDKRVITTSPYAVQSLRLSIVGRFIRWIKGLLSIGDGPRKKRTVPSVKPRHLSSGTSAAKVIRASSVVGRFRGDR